MEENNKQIIDDNSLETPDNSPVSAKVIDSKDADTGVVVQGSAQPETTEQKPNLFKRFVGKINIYFILLAVILLILSGLTYYAIVQNHKADKQSTFGANQLSADDLAKIAGTDSSVGDAKQVLTVESNAVFTGGMLVKGNVDIVGGIKVGSNLSLPGLTVGGVTTVESLAAKSLTVSGDSAIQGKLTIQNGLNVTGGASFSGTVSAPQVTTDKLQLSGDLQLSRHVSTNGGVPNRSNGSALGGGGSASVSGNDISGSITISTGNAAPAGCFINITFSAAYGSVPKVVLSPTSTSAANINYYATRTSTGFSVCSASDPADNTPGMTFDYIVIG